MNWLLVIGIVALVLLAIAVFKTAFKILRIALLAILAVLAISIIISVIQGQNPLGKVKTTAATVINMVNQGIEDVKNIGENISEIKNMSSTAIGKANKTKQVYESLTERQKTCPARIKEKQKAG